MNISKRKPRVTKRFRENQASTSNLTCLITLFTTIIVMTTMETIITSKFKSVVRTFGKFFFFFKFLSDIAKLNWSSSKSVLRCRTFWHLSGEELFTFQTILVRTCYHESRITIRIIFISPKTDRCLFGRRSKTATNGQYKQGRFCKKMPSSARPMRRQRTRSATCEILPLAVIYHVKRPLY